MQTIALAINIPWPAELLHSINWMYLLIMLRLKFLIIIYLSVKFNHIKNTLLPPNTHIKGFLTESIKEGFSPVIIHHLYIIKVFTPKIINCHHILFPKILLSKPYNDTVNGSITTILTILVTALTNLVISPRNKKLTALITLPGLCHNIDYSVPLFTINYYKGNLIKEHWKSNTKPLNKIT